MMASASNVNVLLSSFPGLALPSTLSFSLPATSTISELTEQIKKHLPSSVTLQSLTLTTTSNKRLVPSSDRLTSLLVATHGENKEVSSLLPLRLTVPLVGGKGGFGSQLRAAGGRMSSKRKRNQGDNNGSSRNLDGRRLRTINEAKALAEYLAVKPEMDRKEKEERRRRWQAVVEAAEKRQDELKNGGGKHKIDGQWMEDKDQMNEKAREAVLLVMKDGAWTDNLCDPVVGGSSTGASEGSAQESLTSSEGESDGGSSPDAAKPPEQSKAKSTTVSYPRFIRFDEDDEFMSDSEAEQEMNEEDQSQSKGKGRA